MFLSWKTQFKYLIICSSLKAVELSNTKWGMEAGRTVSEWSSVNSEGWPGLVVWPQSQHSWFGSTIKWKWALVIHWFLILKSLMIYVIIWIVRCLDTWLVCIFVAIIILLMPIEVLFPGSGQDRPPLGPLSTWAAHMSGGGFFSIVFARLNTLLKQRLVEQWRLSENMMWGWVRERLGEALRGWMRYWFWVRAGCKSVGSKLSSSMLQAIFKYNSKELKFVTAFESWWKPFLSFYFYFSNKCLDHHIFSCKEQLK